MLLMNDAVLPPKTALLSFPGGHRRVETAGEEVMYCDGKAKATGVSEDGNFEADRGNPEEETNGVKADTGTGGSHTAIEGHFDGCQYSFFVRLAGVFGRSEKCDPVFRSRSKLVEEDARWSSRVLVPLVRTGEPRVRYHGQRTTTGAAQRAA